MNEFDIVAFAAAAAVACAGVVGGLRRPRAVGGPVGFADAVRCGAWIVGAMAAACVIGVPLGVGAFGVIRLLYLAGVVSVPLAALVLLGAHLAGNVRVSRPALAALGGGLLLAPLGVWMSFVEPTRLQLETTEVVLARERASGEPIRFGVLADLQCEGVGAHERRAVDELMAQRPDVILLPGDFMQVRKERWPERSREMGALLARLDAPGGVWAILGDVDRSDTPEVLAGTKVRFLLDEVVHVRVRGRDVTIGGVLVHGDAHAVVEELERDAERGDVRILLAHRPDAVLGLRPGSRIDLTVAGHTHGGQVVIPGFGPPMTLSRVPRAVAAGGLHEIEGNRIYVSRGVGMERMQAPRMRLFCPPEISVLTVTGPVTSAE